VAEELLDAAQVGAVLEQMGGEGVPQRMRGALGETRCVELAPQRPADVGGAEGAAADAQEDAVGRRPAEAGAARAQVAPERVRSGASERDDPLLTAFPGHAHRALIGIHVGDP